MQNRPAYFIFIFYVFLLYMSIEEIKRLPFVFIVGMGRSGTTLMQTILDANENVILPIESRLIIHQKKKYFSVTRWSPALIDAFITDLYKDKKFSQYWAVDPVTLRKSIDALPIEELTFQVLCKMVYLGYPSPFPKGRILLLGDKNPVYSTFIKDLTEVFPEARFIHLTRDYRDNITSNRQVFRRQNVAQLALKWKVYNILIEAEKKKRKDRFYMLKYEDLAARPDLYVPEICRFLEITFYPGMLDYYTTMQQVTERKYKKEIVEVHPNIVKPVNTAQVQKWKKALTEQEIEIIDYVAGKYAARYGYIRETHKWKLSYPFRYLAACFTIYTDLFVIRSYYRMPFVFRDAIGRFTGMLYRRFRIVNHYNEADFRFKE